MRASSAASSLLTSMATDKRSNSIKPHESEVKLEQREQQQCAELERSKLLLLQQDDEDDHTSGISSSSNNNGDEEDDEEETEAEANAEVEDEEADEVGRRERGDDDDDDDDNNDDDGEDHKEEEQRQGRRRGRRALSDDASATETKTNDKTNEQSRPKRRATNTHIFRYLQTRNPSRLEEIDLKRALEASLEDCPDEVNWPAEDSSSCCGLSDQCNGCGFGTPKSILSSSELSSSASSSASTSSSTGAKLGTTESTSVNMNTCHVAKINKTSSNNMRRSQCSTTCAHNCNPNQRRIKLQKAATIGKRRRSSSAKSRTQRNHLCQYHYNSAHNIHNCNQHCPNSTIHHQNNGHSTGHTANPNCCPLSTSVQSRYKPVARKTIYHEADFFHEGIMEYIEYVLLNSQGSR